MSPVSVQHELQQHAVKERQWSTAVAAVISSGPAFLLGVTLGFPSLLLGTFDLSSTQADNFGVSRDSRQYALLWMIKVLSQHSFSFSH